jgi:Xaa-Pro aminopeptidase
MKTLFARRRKALQTQLAERRLSSLLITDPVSWYYLAGFTGDAGALIVSRRGTILFTDGRFTAQARQETSAIRIIPQKGSLASAVGQFFKGGGRVRVGFDPGQVTVAQLRAVQKEVGPRVRLVPVNGLVQQLRNRKDPEEIARMRKAAMLASGIMKDALKLLKPGVREFEVAAEIEYQMRQRGGSGPAFETIVAFGERSAYPHARPTGKRLRKNELVVLDLGVILAHYCSDITRTVVVGGASARVRRWHKAVQEAQEAAIESTNAGVRCEEVDAAARRVLAGYRLDRYFVHSTGHGLGLAVHEDPRIAKGQTQTLEPGNVITIEPGVYVPGVGGIRIEDDVAIHAGRTEVLTRGARELIEI